MTSLHIVLCCVAIHHWELKKIRIDSSIHYETLKNPKKLHQKKTPFSVRNEKKSKNFKMLTPTQCKWKISHLQMNVNCYNFSHNRRSKMKLPLFNTRNSETNNYGKMTTEGIQFWLSHLLFPIYQYTYGLSSSEF